MIVEADNSELATPHILTISSDKNLLFFSFLLLHHATKMFDAAVELHNSKLAFPLKELGLYALCCSLNDM